MTPKPEPPGQVFPNAWPTETLKDNKWLLFEATKFGGSLLGIID